MSSPKPSPRTNAQLGSVTPRITIKPPAAVPTVTPLPTIKPPVSLKACPADFPTIDPTMGIRPSPRFKPPIEKLTQHGYVIDSDSKIYEDNRLAYILARTQSGDPVLIQVSSSFADQPGPTDSYMEKVSNGNLGLPSDLKIAVLEFIRPNLSRAAFVCENGLCVVDNNLREENYTMKKGSPSSFGIYPVVSLDEILENPTGVEHKLAAVSHILTKIQFRRLQIYQEELQEAVDRLQHQVRNLGLLLNEAQSQFNEDISKLNRAYHKFGAAQLSPEDRNTYQMILKGLTSKKDLQSRFISSMARSYGVTNTVKSISEDLGESIDPILNEFQSSIGMV